MSSILGSLSGRSGLLLQAVVVGVTLTLIVRGLILHAARRRMQKEHGCLPLAKERHFKQTWYIPGVGIDSVVQQLKNAREGRLLETQLERARTYGETYKNRMVLEDFIITCDPQNVKAVLATKFKDFGLNALRSPSFGPLLGKGIFISDGATWHHSRGLIRPAFNRETLADLEAFERHFQIMLSMIPRDGTNVDLLPLFFALTIDAATEFLFGQSVDALREMKNPSNSSDINNSFAKAFDYSQNAGMVKFRLRSFARFYSDPRNDQSIAFCHAFLQPFIETAIRNRKLVVDEEKPRKYVFLEQLAKETDDPVILRDELMNILLAGRDTTASLLSNFWFVLARRPDIYARLKAEIDGLDGELPTYETLRNLKYLKYCLNESLRLHPVVPLNARMCMEDTVLPRGGGPDGTAPLFVKKGQLVSYYVYVIHRRKDIFGEDAEEFRPERWAEARPDWGYIPFNAGPRICPGQQYALTEASYVTVRLMQEFGRMENRDPIMEWRENMSLTCCPWNGVKVGLYERT